MTRILSFALISAFGLLLLAGLSGCAQHPTYTMAPISAPRFPNWKEKYAQGGSEVGAYRTGGHPLTHLTADSALHAPMEPFHELQ